MEIGGVMSRRANLLNNVLSLFLTVAFLVLAILTVSNRYPNEATGMIIYLFISAIVWGFVSTLFHELGHYFYGKANGFSLLSFTVWFFRWSKRKNKVVFDFVFLGEEAGSTETVAKHTENLALRYKKMTFGGLLFTFVLVIVGAVPFFISSLPAIVCSIWIMLFPMASYVFFGNALPMVNSGALNDGAVLRGIRKDWDTVKVAVSLLKIQSELYNGKTPAEIDSSYYFDLPQLAEDDMNFLLLLNARYYYYLEIADYVNAKKVSDRALSLLEYMPKSINLAIKTDCLFNSCTFDYNEDVADDLMYELEGYLNSNNTATNIRVKLAYLTFIQKQTDAFEDFYNKGIKEIKNINVDGLKKLETKLFERLKEQKAVS
jgi:hypothetical protein